MHADWLSPEWPAPSRVRAVSTTRDGGVSTEAFASLNLGAHVGDVPASVAENRQRLMSALALKHEPRWLQQVHGTRVARLDGKPVQEPADAAMTAMVGEACVIMTADCLPVVFCDREGTRVAAAHAGWRGLMAGVLETTVQKMGTPRGDILAWFGPAIGPKAYEVGDEVREAFVAQTPGAVAAFASTGAAGKWRCDLYMLARQRLEGAGVRGLYGGGLCTYTDQERFFSFRRDGQCGRMATLIWIDPS